MRSKKVQSCFISIAVAAATMCLCASDEDKSLYKSILPRCVDFQEPEVNFFDQLESVENQIVDSLLKIHALESRLQKIKSVRMKNSFLKSYQPVDYNEFLKRQAALLVEVNNTLLHVQEESKKFADPAALEKGTGRNTNNTNGFNAVEREKK